MTLKALLNRHGIALEVIGSASLDWNKRDDWQKNANGYRVRLSRKNPRRSMTLDFWQGIGISGDPTAESVVSCLLSDASCPDTFEEFCAELGYDADSRKAEATFRAARAQSRKFEDFCADLIPALLSAEDR